jgi:CAAX protease family protein
VAGTRIARWAEAHPGLLAMRLFGWVAIVVPVAVPLLFSATSRSVRQLEGQLLLALTAIVLLSLLGWWQRSGLGSLDVAGPGWIVWIAMVPLVRVVPLLTNSPQLAVLRDGASLAALALGAFALEALARGVLLTAFETRGETRAVLLSAAWYGLIHIASVFSTFALAGVGLQIVRTTGMGILYGAVRLRIGTLWPVVTAHFLTDLVGVVYGYNLASIGPTDWILDIGLGASFAAGGLILMRRTKPFILV